MIDDEAQASPDHHEEPVGDAPAGAARGPQSDAGPDRSRRAAHARGHAHSRHRASIFAAGENAHAADKKTRAEEKHAQALAKHAHVAQKRAHAAEKQARPSRARSGDDRLVRSRRAPRVMLGVVVLLAAIAVVVFGVWSTLYRAAANVPAGRTVTITVPKGASGDQVATLLAKAGVVTNATMFRLRASALNAAASMKPGTYIMKTGSGYDSVIRELQAGPQIVYVTFTVPEGWSVESIAARVESKFGIPASTFLKLATSGAARFDYPFLADDRTGSLEGYLFPKTYTLKASANATDVINVMLAQYGKETAGLDFSYAQSKGIDPHEALTIASIVEREAVLDKDRPKVASVIYNRLAIGMRLQLDSTVQYVLHGKAKLTLSDLKSPSPYNTYLHAGVPPGPICNPGLPSIEAALHPAKTKFIYYILTGKDGSQSFTTNYAQFLQLKAQTKKGLK